MRTTITGVVRRLAVLCVSIVLVGCEAPLTMDRVEQAMQKPIHRTDRYQAAATHENRVVVVGNQGVVVHSRDGGATWGRTELPEWPALIDVAACPNGDFVALAFLPKVFVSDDGGASWKQRPLPTEENPQALTCAPDGTMWVVGAFATRWWSTDGGKTWEEATTGEDIILTTVQFLDEQHGVITGEFGTVMITADGGETWETKPPLVDEFYPQTTYFRDAQTGWIGGLGGVILHTKDGGETWTAQDTETEVPIYGIEQVGSAVYAVGGEGVLMRLDGERWALVDHGKAIRLYLRVIRNLGPSRALIAGVGGTLHIIDLNDA